MKNIYLRRYRCRRDANIKTHLNEILCEVVTYSSRVQWRTHTNKPQMLKIFDKLLVNRSLIK